VDDVKVDADYFNIDVTANVSGFIVGANYEFLSGSSQTDAEVKTFIPALGTNHKFNGWADRFLSTPTGGLQDANIRLGYKAKGLGKVLAVYHMYTADVNMAAGTGTSDDLGSEFDALYANKIPGFKGLSGLLKAAYYMSGDVDGYTNDTAKFWAQLDYKF
jgi:hypothetical protein